jgi:hypothetical protein
MCAATGKTRKWNSENTCYNKNRVFLLFCRPGFEHITGWVTMDLMRSYCNGPKQSRRGSLSVFNYISNTNQPIIWEK